MRLKNFDGNFVALIFVLFVFIFAFYFSKGDIVGNIVIDFERHSVGVFVDKSKSFVLSLSEGVPVNLKSLGVSGEVFGVGRVKIFVDNGFGVRRLVFSNEEGANAVLSVDGDFAQFSNDKIKGFDLSEYRVLTPEFYDGSGTEVFAGSFKRVCGETCELESGLFNSARYELLFFVEDGASVRLKEVLYK